MGRQLGAIDQALVNISHSTAKTANVGNGEFGAYFISDTDTHKVVDYNGLSSLFIEAIKELKDQNELLKAEIEELKINS